MKISSETVSLLQSFSNINSNLLVKPGNKLATKNAVNSIQSRAIVQESFPTQFAIYDLNQLLSLISVSQGAEIEFGEKSLVIKAENGGEVEYFYADESLVQAPSEDPPELETLYSFTVTPSDISTIQKISSIVSATMLNVVSENGTVTLSLNDPKNPTAHSYKKILGDSSLNFDVKMPVDTFKVVPEEYTVNIANAIGRAGKVLVFFLSCKNRDLTYLIAADATSRI